MSRGLCTLVSKVIKQLTPWCHAVAPFYTTRNHFSVAFYLSALAGTASHPLSPFAWLGQFVVGYFAVLILKLFRVPRKSIAWNPEYHILFLYYIASAIKVQKSMHRCRLVDHSFALCCLEKRLLKIYIWDALGALLYQILFLIFRARITRQSLADFSNSCEARKRVGWFPLFFPLFFFCEVLSRALINFSNRFGRMDWI